MSTTGCIFPGVSGRRVGGPAGGPAGPGGQPGVLLHQGGDPPGRGVPGAGGGERGGHHRPRRGPQAVRGRQDGPPQVQPGQRVHGAALRAGLRRPHRRRLRAHGVRRPRRQRRLPGAPPGGGRDPPDRVGRQPTTPWCGGRTRRPARPPAVPDRRQAGHLRTGQREPGDRGARAMVGSGRCACGPRTWPPRSPTTPATTATPPGWWSCPSAGRSGRSSSTNCGEVLRSLPPRPAYYPGAEETYDRYLASPRSRRGRSAGGSPGCCPRPCSWTSTRRATTSSSGRSRGARWRA